MKNLRSQRAAALFRSRIALLRYPRKELALALHMTDAHLSRRLLGNVAFTEEEQESLIQMLWPLDDEAAKVRTLLAKTGVEE